MKTLFLTVVGATLAFATTAQQISFEKTTHDFGEVAKNSEAIYNFEFTNTGDAPLVISACNSTCGCTTPTCPKDKPINPGEKGSVAVKYNRTDNVGSFNKTITVNSNATNSPVTSLTIRGNVK
jgi:hypothetical protein